FLALATVGEGPDPSVEPLLETLGQSLVPRVHAGEQRVAAAARDGQGIELGRLERLLVVRAVGVPSLGATPIDHHVELTVRPELVDPELSDLRVVRVARRLRRVRHDEPEPATVAQEVFDLELLARHHDHVGVEPRAVDLGEAGVVERLDVDAEDLRADLLAEASNLDHRSVLPVSGPLLSSTPRRRSREWSGR